MVHIAIFASGRGSNAQAIIEYLKDNAEISVSLIVSNKANAGVLLLADEYNIPSVVFSRSDFTADTKVVETIKSNNVSIIVLAGFLWKIPDYLIRNFPASILNIHPALLPKYGGKGMYGAHVHQAVFDNKDEESGITIHLVNEKYDEGEILFQASKELEPDDDAEAIAKKVLELEHYYYPRVVEAFVEGQ